MLQLPTQQKRSYKVTISKRHGFIRKQLWESPYVILLLSIKQAVHNNTHILYRVLCVAEIRYSSPGIFKPTTNTSIKTRNSYLIDPYSVRTNIMNAVVWFICPAHALATCEAVHVECVLFQKLRIICSPNVASRGWTSNLYGCVMCAC